MDVIRRKVTSKRSNTPATSTYRNQRKREQKEEERRRQKGRGTGEEEREGEEKVRGRGDQKVREGKKEDIVRERGERGCERKTQF